MKRMSRERYQACRTWLMNHARPIERARYACLFEAGPAGDVLTELARFENGDGGYGHGLEPDVRLGDSSVICTTVALQVLASIEEQADVAGPAERAIGYLLAALDESTLAWENVPANVNDAPHAPWWKPGDRPTGFTANPGAEIVGHFHRWSQFVPADVLARLTDAAVAHVAEPTRELAMHDVLCYERLLDTPALPTDIRQRIEELIHGRALAAVETDPSKWGGYCLRPLQLAPTPQSRYAEPLAAAIETNLDCLIESQTDQGVWALSWSWGAEGGQAWEQAEREWRGVVALEHLLTLRAYGRVG